MSNVETAVERKKVGRIETSLFQVTVEAALVHDCRVPVINT